MTEKLPFQFKLLRYIHDAFTGEFLNIGLALYNPDVPYFRVRLLHKYSRITSTFPGADGELYRQLITSLQNKYDALAEEINTRQLILLSPKYKTFDEILGSVLPYDDSAIQFGSVQGGMAFDLEAVFDDLYNRLIETYLSKDNNLSRNDQDIWNQFNHHLRPYNVISKLHPIVLQVNSDDIKLEHAWRNGQVRALQPISFDLQNPGSIQNKGHQWLGTSVILNDSQELAKVYYLLGKPLRDDNSLQKAYSKAKDILGSGRFTQKFEIIEEDGVDDFAKFISQQIIQDTEQH